MIPSHILFLGEKKIFGRWRKPVHVDRAVKSILIWVLNYCDKQNEAGHVCEVNGDCKRFTGVMEPGFYSIQPDECQYHWNHYLPLMWIPVWVWNGLFRLCKRCIPITGQICSCPLMEKVRELANQTVTEMESNIYPVSGDC